MILPLIFLLHVDEPVCFSARHLVGPQGAVDVDGGGALLLAGGWPVHLLLRLPHPRPRLLPHDGRRLHLLRRRPLNNLPDCHPLQAYQVKIQFGSCYVFSILRFLLFWTKQTNKQYVFSSRHLGAKKTILVGLSAQLVELVWYGVSTAEWGVWAAGMISY